MPHRRTRAHHSLSNLRSILAFAAAVVVLLVMVGEAPGASARSAPDVARPAVRGRPPQPQPASTAASIPPRVGQPAPDFTLPTRTGDKIQLRFLRVRPVVLCFFCNCGLCRAIAVELARATPLTQKAQVVVIASDANVVDHVFGLQTGLEALYLKDSPPSVARRYASEGCPRCWLLDRQGTVRYVNSDRLTPAKQLVKGLESALAGIRPPEAPRVVSGFQREIPRAAPLLPIPAGRGTILTDAKKFRVTLRAERRLVTVESSEGRAEIATGRYDLLDWWVEARDAAGRLWQARGGFRPFALTVMPDATVRLNLVSPLQARLAASRGADGVEFDVVFQGTGDDVCLGVTVDGRDPPRPHVEVRDGAGRVLADLEATYCCGFKANAQWRPPADLRGTLTAVPKVDFGPFSVAAQPVRLELGESGLVLQDPSTDRSSDRAGDKEAQASRRP